MVIISSLILIWWLAMFSSISLTFYVLQVMAKRHVLNRWFYHLWTLIWIPYSPQFPLREKFPKLCLVLARAVHSGQMDLENFFSSLLDHYWGRCVQLCLIFNTWWILPNYNANTIILIPKTNDANSMNNFRPIAC